MGSDCVHAVGWLAGLIARLGREMTVEMRPGEVVGEQDRDARWRNVVFGDKSWLGEEAF